MKVKYGLWTFVFSLFFLVFSLSGEEASAFSVEYEPSGAYADLISKKVSNYAVKHFKSDFENAKSLVNKYKNSSSYSFYKNVGDKRQIYEKFKNVKDNEKIILTYPFAVYDPLEDDDLSYYFVVLKKGKPAACYNVEVDLYSEDRTLAGGIEWTLTPDKKDLEKESVFYRIDRNVYIENEEEKQELHDGNDGSVDAGPGLSEGEKKEIKNFEGMDFDSKKDYIIGFLKKLNSEKFYKKALSRVDDSGENKTADQTTARRGSKINVSALIRLAAALVIILASVVAIISLKKKRK